jgi:peptidoglycan/xylan/chitin deacetylase (PgdA/CDA1 family)
VPADARTRDEPALAPFVPRFTWSPEYRDFPLPFPSGSWPVDALGVATTDPRHRPVPRTTRTTAAWRWMFLTALVLGAVIVLAMSRVGGERSDPAATLAQSTATVPGTAPLIIVATASEQGYPETPAAGGDGSAGVEPSPTARQPLPPNELGQIPILMYHHIGPIADEFVRTPVAFRSDLQWLYDHNFYVVNLHDVLTDSIDIPAGKQPVVLTFDDSPASQFAVTATDSGQLLIDHQCAVGIMEAFFAAHPDFGRGGHFGVQPGKLFDWTPTEYFADQTPYAADKLRWLVANGYEIGNHTYDHVNLSELSDDEVEYQLAAADDAIHAVLPDTPIEVVTLPYGMYPDGGDDLLLRGFDYQGQHYAWDAALMVGANPTVSPLSTEYDPFAMARIQTFEEEITKWFAVMEENPGILYVSDGNPDTVTVPEDLHPWLVGTLDESKIGDRELIRY